MNKKERFDVFTMGFYGNRTIVPCYDDEDIDCILTGYTNKELMRKMAEPIDKRFVKIPNSKCYVLYNNHNQDNSRPVIIIPEENIKVYGRCIICRKDNDNITGIETDDIATFEKYIVD